jgi:methyl-accepting chemotaxis protein
MAEQSTAAAQVASTTKMMSRQSDQVSKGVTEQARAAREVTAAIEGISKDVGAITRANRSHLESSGKALAAIDEIRQVATRNAASAKSLSSSASTLTQNARNLADLMNGTGVGNQSNGNASPAIRKRTKRMGSSGKA